MGLEISSAVSRRGVLKAASSAGVLTYGSTSVIATNPLPVVEYVHRIKVLEGGTNNPKRVPIYRTMEREEWNRRSGGSKAASKIYRKIDQFWEPTLIRPYFTLMDDSPIGFGVNVDYHHLVKRGGDTRSPPVSKNEVENRLPDRITVEYDGNEYTSKVKVTESEHVRAGHSDCGQNTNDMCCET